MPKSETHLIDCLEFMRSLPDKAFDLTFADVPYGIDEANKVLSRVRPVKQKNGSYIKMTPLHQKKDWDKEPPTQEYFDELFRVSKYQVIFGSNYLQFTQKSLSSGRIFWDKVNGNSDYSDGELLWTNLFKGIRQFNYMWNGFCQAVSIDEPFKQRGNKKQNETRIHPSQKPIDLYFWILKNYTKQGWNILDTHLGSGRSRIAAYDLGFDFVGCELDKDYFDAQEKRFAEHIKQPQLFTTTPEPVEQARLF